MSIVVSINRLIDAEEVKLLNEMIANFKHTQDAEVLLGILSLSFVKSIS